MNRPSICQSAPVKTVGRKRRFPALCLIFPWIMPVFLFLLSCGGRGEEEQIQERVASEQTVARSFQPPPVSRPHMEALFRSQEQIKHQPEAKTLQAQLLQQALFPEQKALVTIGIGLMRHPESGQRVQKGLVQRAAIADAQRWAAYVLQWHQHGPGFPFGRLQTQLVSPAQVLQEWVRNDTLFVVVAFELPEQHSPAP